MADYFRIADETIWTQLREAASSRSEHGAIQTNRPS
jgi:hypothetical protein